MTKEGKKESWKADRQRLRLQRLDGGSKTACSGGKGSEGSVGGRTCVIKQGEAAARAAEGASTAELA